MEIKIESKRNNPLLNRTEVHFTVKHEGEGTPNREIIRNELVDKLNVKKENIIISIIDSSFGSQESTGYARVYTSIKQSKSVERKHFLIRNKLITEESKKKEEKKREEKPTAPEGKPEEASEPQKEDEKKIEEVAPAEEKPEETGKQPEERSEAEQKSEEKTSDEGSGEDKDKSEGEDKKKE